MTPAVSEDMVERIVDDLMPLMTGAPNITFTECALKRNDALNVVRAALSTLAPSAAASEDACPICAVAFKPDDTCAMDIELGTCHAACLEGSPTVDLDTGGPVEGPVATYPYKVAGDAAASCTDHSGVSVTTLPDGREAAESPSLASPSAEAAQPVAGAREFWLYYDYQGPGAWLVTDHPPTVVRSFEDEVIHVREVSAQPQGELREALDLLAWVETWVSNPVGSYSVQALDGLFAMTRDRLAALAGRTAG